MRINLDTDPGVVRISSGLKMDRFAVVGRLHKIWSWANDHLSSGSEVPIDAAFLDILAEYSGFAAAMRDVGWLDGRDGSISFPRFNRHNGESAKARGLDALRKKASRENDKKESGKCPDKNRTKSRPEERREEKSREENKEEEEDKPAVDEFVDSWNRSGKFIKCLAVTEKRKKSIKARLAEPFFSEQWGKALEKLCLSSFCNGQNDRGWKPDIDWFLRPDSVPKILEGKYDDKVPAGTYRGPNI